MVTATTWVTAVAQVQSLARGHPHAAGEAKKKKKEKSETDLERYENRISWIFFVGGSHTHSMRNSRTRDQTQATAVTMPDP